MLLATCLSAVYFATAERLTPEQALMNLRTPRPGENIESLRKTAEKSVQLRRWSVVFAARELERRNDAAAALKILAPILKESSAAQVEGALLDARLRLEIGPEKGAKIGRDLSGLPASAELSMLARKFRRPDLDAEVLFTIGRMEEVKGDPSAALKRYEELRRRYPTSEFAGKARDRSRILRTGATAQNFPLLLAETRQLVVESEFTAAKETLAAAQKLAAPGSADHFESLFVEELLRRKDQKPLEADEILLRIAADAPADQAAKALFQSAKNSWNENDQLHALELLDQLAHRFLKSPLLSEVRYIEGRILEELGKFSEAEKAYGKIADSDAEPLARIRAAKRMSWLEYLRGNYEDSLQLSERCFTFASNALSTQPPPEPSDRQELFSERVSAIFWKAKALREMKGATEGAELKSLLWEIVRIDPRGYYSVLARVMLEQLGEKPPPFLAPGTAECESADEYPALQSRLKDFTSLRDLAQHEIDYFFAELREEGSRPAEGLLLTLHSRWSGKSGLISSQVELAEEGLKQIRLGIMVSKCDQNLAKLAFPLPYSELFQPNAQKQRLPATYPIAIARTESYFRSDARSPVGALGLMQLMPATAKREGWDEKIPLTDPAVNIALGTKHLARLLNQFEGDLIKASAAYNAGEAAVNRWLSRYGTYPGELFVEFIGYPETNKYVRRVLASHCVYKELLPPPPKALPF